MAVQQPTEKQIRFLRKFRIEPPPSQGTCRSAISYILGEKGMSRETPAQRAARYRAARRLIAGKRVRDLLRGEGIIKYVVARHADTHVRIMVRGKSLGPFAAFVAFDNGSSVIIGIRQLEFIETREAESLG